MNLLQRKPTQNDLIALHLHELSPRRERHVRRVLQTDAGLAHESEAIAATLGQFSADEAYPAVDIAALHRSWMAVSSSIPVRVPKAAWRGWRPAWVGAGACAIAATAVALLMQHVDRHPQMAATNPPAVPAWSEPKHVPIEGDAMGGYVKDEPAFAERFVERRVTGAPGTKARGTDVRAAETTDGHLRIADGGRSFAAEPSELSTSRAPGAGASVSDAAAGALAQDASSSLSGGKAASARASRGVQPKLVEPNRSAGEVTVAALGNLIASRSSTDSVGAGTSGGTRLTGTHSERASASAGGLVSFHQQFARWAGYRVTASYSQPSFTYGYKPSPVSGEVSSTVASQMYEVSGTYVLRGPHYRRLSTTAEAGVGVLVFLSKRTADKTYSVAPVVGAGAELALSEHLSLQAQYRALIFNVPEFQDTGSTIPAEGYVTVNSQPSLGMTYRFGERRHD